jgi:hypothetical protein
MGVLVGLETARTREALVTNVALVHLGLLLARRSRVIGRDGQDVDVLDPVGTMRSFVELLRERQMQRGGGWRVVFGTLRRTGTVLWRREGVDGVPRGGWHFVSGCAGFVKATAFLAVVASAAGGRGFVVV